MSFPPEMSTPTEIASNDFDFNLSIPLTDADFSLPLIEELPLPTETHGDEYEFSFLDSEEGNDGSTLILASFLAGISALVLAAGALFVKMRRVHGRQMTDESMEQNHNVDVRAQRHVSFAFDEDLLWARTPDQNVVQVVLCLGLVGY